MIASMIAKELGRVYQCVYAVHEDTDQVHFHFAFNPVSFINGYKYSGTKGEHKELKQKIEKCVKAMGIHILYEVKYYPETKDCYE